MGPSKQILLLTACSPVRQLGGAGFLTAFYHSSKIDKNCVVPQKELRHPANDFRLRKSCFNI
jgi:hypothetical protein